MRLDYDEDVKRAGELFRNTMIVSFLKKSIGFCTVFGFIFLAIAISINLVGEHEGINILLIQIDSSLGDFTRGGRGFFLFAAIYLLYCMCMYPVMKRLNEELTERA